MNRTYDIVIAGGGVIGASCAYQLSRRGNLRIAVVDDKRPGNATRASAGGLWAIGESVGLGCGVIFFRMMSSRNRREAQGAAVAVDASTPHILPPAFFDLALQSNALYPELHRELIERHGMDFKFERTGLKYVIQDDEDRQYAEHIVAQIPHLAEQVRWLDHSAWPTPTWRRRARTASSCCWEPTSPACCARAGGSAECARTMPGYCIAAP